MSSYKDTIEQIKALSEDILEYESVDVQAAYVRLGKRMREERNHRLLMRTFTRVAAVLLLPLLVSSILLSVLYIKQKERVERVASNQVTCAPGTVTRLVLPDKSIVWLNSGSTLTYPSVFSDEAREVNLLGEGYFEVESDPEHPFYVTIGEGVRIMAYGTRFNVNAYADEPYVEAVLEKGKIDVISPDKTVRLDPDRQALFNKETGELRVMAVNPEEKTSWRDGRLVFRNTPLDMVLKKLSKRYNVDIVLHKNGNKEYKYRATFKTETIEQILNYLKLTAPIEWSVRGLTQNDDASFVRERIDVYLR